MRLRMGAWCFAPALWPSVATVLLLPALLGLGFWQLDRADQKQRLQQEYDQRLDAPALVITDNTLGVQELKFRRVQVRGRYDTAREILLDNRVHQGQAGYHVLTPLQLAGGKQVILVNRGWVAMGRDRRERPPTPAPEGEVELTGVAVLPPAPGLRLGPPYSNSGAWPVVWQYLDIEAFAARAGVAVLPVVILLDSDNTTAGGFVRQWARLDAGIATHHGYALTWFSLAAVLAAIYILLNTRRCHE